MIIEIRHYTTKPGLREEFIAFFESTNREALRDAGMQVFGPMRDLENPDKVHWMRAFETLKDRDTIKEDFYGGTVWSKEIEPLVRPLLVLCESELTETTNGFEDFKSQHRGDA